MNGNSCNRTDNARIANKLLCRLLYGQFTRKSYTGKLFATGNATATSNLSYPVRFSDGKSSDEKAGGAGAVVFLTTPAPLTEELNGKLLETFVELPDCGRAKKDNVGNSGVGEI